LFLFFQVLKIPKQLAKLLLLFSFGTRNKIIANFFRKPGDKVYARNQILPYYIQELRRLEYKQALTEDSDEENSENRNEIKTPANNKLGFLVCFFGLHGSFLLLGMFVCNVKKKWINHI
jgi:hypothetical protein